MTCESEAYMMPMVMQSSIACFFVKFDVFSWESQDDRMVFLTNKDLPGTLNNHF